jgi:hypothetical protein
MKILNDITICDWKNLIEKTSIQLDLDSIKMKWDANWCKTN